MSAKPPNPLGRPESGIGEGFADQLRRIAKARGKVGRAKAIDELAESVQAANAALPVLSRLIGSDRHGQRLALEIVLRLPLPLPDSVCRLLRPAIASPRVSVHLRLNAAVQALRSMPPDATMVPEMLQAVTDGLPPMRALERLRFIQQRFPTHPAIDWACEELGKQAAIPCPRCGVRLQRPALVMHLWQAHRLLMDGSRARDPWKMIEDWVRNYAGTGRKDLLERSLELGQQLDPENGLMRVHRALLKNGLSDEEARQNLTSEAAGRRANICPHCYALVTQKEEALPAPMSLSRGRIAGNGFTVEVSDRYIFSRLLVATPTGIIHEGAEPDHELTQRGSVVLQVGPIVLFALLAALFFPRQVAPPLIPVPLMLLVALIVYLRIRLSHEQSGEPTQRAIDHAWNLVVPALHRPEFSPEDAELISSLAATSIGHGSPESRERSLERVCKLTRERLANSVIGPESMTALRCLEMDDAMRLKRDPVLILADDLGACISGELPLHYAEQLLDAWPSDARDQGERARLRILVCARAFEMGLEAGDLNELGRVSPALGQAFASEDLPGLVRLRWIWNAKPDRVWRRNGPATTVFDLARYPMLGGEFLESRPDLLLFQPMSIGDDLEAGAPILICEQGIVYREIVIGDPETPVSVKAKSMLLGGGFDLVIGKQKLHFKQDPSPLMARLQGWKRFLFRDVLPGARGLLGKRNRYKLEPLLYQKTILCPECGNSFLALRGEVGIVTNSPGVG